jgi:hypothetical protein
MREFKRRKGGLRGTGAQGMSGFPDSLAINDFKALIDGM